MKQPSKRRTTSLGESPTVHDTGKSRGKFATFSRPDTPNDAIKDLKFYMEEFRYPSEFQSLEDQINFMKSKGYFGAPKSEYLAGVRRQLNNVADVA